MLKQLLQLLLNTRTTPSEAAHNAAPGRIDIGISGQEYICPADGFVTASANARNVGGFDMQLYRNGLSVQGGPQEVSVPAWTQSAMIPVAKGDTVNLSLYNQNSWQWRFISSIGGGYNRFVRRAVLCLKPSFSFSPRSSCKANLSGSAVRHTLQGGLRSRPASPNMSLQRTATWGSTNLIRARITASMFTHSGQTVTSSQEKLLDSLLVPRTSLSQVLFPLRKAIALLSTVPSQSFGSHQQWGVNTNLQTGGALC